MRPKRVCTEAVSYKAPAGDGSEDDDGMFDASDGFDSGDETDNYAEDEEENASKSKDKNVITRKTASGTRVDPAPYWEEITVNKRKPYVPFVPVAAVPAVPAGPPPPPPPSVATLLPESATQARPGTGDSKIVKAEAASHEDELDRDEVTGEVDTGGGDAPAAAATAAIPAAIPLPVDDNNITTTKKIRIQPRVWQDLPKWGKKKGSPL